MGRRGRSYDEQYQLLRTIADSRSSLERQLVDQLWRTKRRLPDDAQRTLADYPSRPDFFFEPNVCVFSRFCAQFFRGSVRLNTWIALPTESGALL